MKNQEEIANLQDKLEQEINNTSNYQNKLAEQNSAESQENLRLQKELKG